MAIQAQMSSGFVFGQDLLTENVYGLNNLCFNLQHHHHQSKPQQQHQELMQRIPKIIDDHRSISQIISAQFDNQRIEIDHYISSQVTNTLKTHPFTLQIQTEKNKSIFFLQNERLRMALQEQRKQQTAVMMKKYESKIQSLMRHKDEEIVRAANRNMELQDCMRKMEMERQTWQRAAQENEAVAASLNQRLRESGGAAEDAESWCGGGERSEERETRKMVCRCCYSRKSCVIMLPCRHLCSCRDCDAFLDCCPVCNVAKKGSLEALL